MKNLLRISDDHPTPPGKHSFRLYIERGSRPPSRTGRVKYVEFPDEADMTKGSGAIFAQMEIGDSALFPITRGEEAKIRSRLTNAASARGVLVTSRATVEDRVYGLRVWRIS
jgi:hypothetical protein